MSAAKRSFAALVLAGLLSAAAPAFAGGLITLTGKLTTITDAEYLIEAEGQVYFLRRKAVPAIEARKLERTETQVTVQVPFEAVERVRSATR